jgi:type I restriction enzyme S subunit
MEVLQDTYKDTKIGRIPIDWEVVMLKDVCKVITSGFSFDVFEKSKIYDGVEVLFTKVSDMNLAGNERIITDSVNKGLFSNEFVSSNSVIKPNSLIFPKRGAAIKTNKKRINGKHIILDPNLIAVSFYDEGTVNYLFTYYYFVNFDLMKIVEDGTIPQINKRDIEPFKIPLPPLKEQQKIAAILSTVDEQISTTDKIIEKSKELKKGLMQKLFSEGIGHTEFKDTKIGRIPKDWDEVILSEISDFITKGATPTTYGFGWVSCGIPFLRSECIGKNGFKTSGLNYISEEAHQALRRSQIVCGDLLMSITGNIGKVVILPKEYPKANINQHIARIRLTDNRVNKAFVYQTLSQKKYIKYYERIITGAAYPQISLKQVRETKIHFPSIPEQEKIAAILLEADAKIEKEQTQKAHLEALKKGLMQQLLTGKKRVKV